MNRKRDSLDEMLSKVDYPFVRARLIETFGGGVMKKDFVALLDKFANNPCAETAKPLLRHEPQLIPLFAGSAESRRWAESHGLPTTEPRKTVSRLRAEPEFQPLVDAFLDDRALYSTLAARLQASGYSPEVIGDAIAAHFADLA